ncbi:oxygen-independent coproporphyrinogen III oxidase [Parabacteroides sp. Marseille-P3160]|uniref:oxygen-independent coproporphyrinogen III oxidase n=1 Tax=Parabacteroides sp. Marseille-P3160 TaxID=1917887 RepID=UPI0009BA53EC|nr:oxygen-independent coproporphyrinogen III oxidase [Parabacteroides sp. Marseille-P3160]
MNQELLNKYSVPVPRYTSYPPANFFHEGFTEESYRQAILESNRQEPRAISFYIHIPFCSQMCYYCGCNAIRMRDRKTVRHYIDAVKKEMQLVFPLISHDRKVSQIHYGGGTPTSLPIEILKELNGQILNEFDCIEQPEIAIECHPGYLKEEYWEALPEAGFNRVSLGIQDFNEEVLKAVRRKPSFLPVEEIVSRMREKDISVNLDFIYGLPLQSVESFTETIRRAITIRPNRIVTFSYAHVPWVNPLQKKLEEAGLPTTDQKEALFTHASALLREAGYQSIGLDHFVLPEDELYHAVKEKALHRNFQGYCTRRTTGQVYAFGVTGISQLAHSYSQNTKDFDTYLRQIEEGRLPVSKGYLLDPQEQITGRVIETLMCNYHIDWQEIAAYFHRPAEEIKQTIRYDEAALAAFARDGLITFDENHLQMLPEATPFVRNVAASLDPLLLHTDKKFSKSI